jgi:hypothetical protein
MFGMPDPPWSVFLPTAQILQQRKPSLASPSTCVCVPLDCSEQQPPSLLPVPTLLDRCCHNSSDEPYAVDSTQCVPLECSEQQPPSLLPVPTLLDRCCHNCSEEPFVAEGVQILERRVKSVPRLLPADLCWLLLGRSCRMSSDEFCHAGSMLVQFVVVAKPRLVGQECCLGRLHSVSVHRFVCQRTSSLSDWTVLQDVTRSADVVLNSVVQPELVLSPMLLPYEFELSQLFSECISSLCVRW